MEKNDNLEVWLWLVLVMRPYNPQLYSVLESCNYDATEAGRIIRDGKAPFIRDSEMSRAVSTRLGTVRDYIKACNSNGITIIPYDSADYPDKLRNIENPPAVLFSMGDVGVLNRKPVLTVVGARDVSDYGIAVTRHLVEPLAKAGTIIASGMAIGADAAANDVCIEAGGRTIAIMGCGVRETHPIENLALKKRIIGSGGCVISELLPDTAATLTYFRRRDAILSGISDAVLVAEAGAKSGSLVTAEFARKQGKAVLVVPAHDIISGKYSGNISLARSGASEVYDCFDIAKALEKSGVKLDLGEAQKITGKKAVGKKPSKPKKIAESGKKSEAEKIPDSMKGAVVVEISEGSTFDDIERAITESFRAKREAEGAASESAARKRIEKLSLELNDDERAVVEFIGSGRRSIDDIIDGSGLSFADINSVLLTLEISEIIIRDADGMYRVNS